MRNPIRLWAKRIRNEDRLKGFGVIDFSREDLEDQVEAIYQLGFPGIKLHPAFQHFRIDGEKAFRVYAAAQERDLFLTFHTGIHWHRISDYNVLLFDEVAYHFKNLRFSMEHVGGYCFFLGGLGRYAEQSKGPAAYLRRADQRF